MPPRFHPVKCMLDFGFFGSFIFVMIMPWIMIFCVTPVLCAILAVKRLIKSRRDPGAKLRGAFQDYAFEFFRAVTYVLFLTYTMLSRQIVKSFRCTYVIDKWLLVDDVDIVCFRGWHIALVILAGLFFLLYCVGIREFSSISKNFKMPLKYKLYS